MTLWVIRNLVKDMKVSEKLVRHLVHSVFKELKSHEVITFKEKEDKVLQRAVDIIAGDFEREQKLDEEVQRMMDDLERQSQGEFQRYKMFPLLKKRLAKEKGIVL